MRSTFAEASFWIAVALAGVVGVVIVKWLALGPLGDRWPGAEKLGAFI